MVSINSIARGPRQSNFELLRMFAMFLVLVTHSDLVALGLPSADDFDTNPLNAFTRTFFESISIVCVNVFVLISGWFGIRPNLKGFLNFIFQCVYFLFGLYLIALLTGWTSLSVTGVMQCLCLTGHNWFIQSYIGLYILSPVLNSFLERSDKRKLEIFLVAFFLFQTYFGLLRSAKFIVEGYSTFSFIGLYVLAHYLKNYGGNLRKWGWLLYLCSIVANTLLYVLQCKYYHVLITFNYINPFVIIGAVGLLLWFSSIRITHNSIINFMSKSCFAVYLLHTNSEIYEPLFLNTVRSIYDSNSGIGCLFMILLFLLIIFAASIICDMPRRAIWEKISARIKWEKFHFSGAFCLK